MLVYIGTFLLFARMFRKCSLAEDEVGGTDLHYKMYRRGALFLVFFAVFSSTLAWDWIMSIDTHLVPRPSSAGTYSAGCG